MDRATYNQCVAAALRGQHFSGPERKREFCIASKTCSGKAESRDQANQLCEQSAAQPKAHKKGRRGGGGGGPGSVSLILLTSTGCKPCADAKAYLKDKIDAGIVRVLDIQKDDFAADLAAKAHIVSVPKLMVVDNLGNPFSEIQISDSEQMVSPT